MWKAVFPICGDTDKVSGDRCEFSKGLFLKSETLVEPCYISSWLARGQRLSTFVSERPLNLAILFLFICVPPPETVRVSIVFLSRWRVLISDQDHDFW